MTALAGFLERFGPEIAVHTWEHVYLTVVSLALAAALAVPLGVWLTQTRRRRVPPLVLGAAGVVQTIPSLALLALMVAVFIVVNRVYGGPEWYRTGGIVPTIGVLPAVVALVLYAVFPILRNTYTGIRQVDPATVEVAVGLGMTRAQGSGRCSCRSRCRSSWRGCASRRSGRSGSRPSPGSWARGGSAT